MQRDAMMVFRLPMATKEALMAAAEAEQRSVSNLIVVIVGEWLRTNGHLADTPPKAPARRAKKGK